MAGTEDDAVAQEKERLRAWARQTRAACSAPARTAASEALSARVLALVQDRSLQAVGLYAAFGDELSVDGLAQALASLGITTFFPRIAGPHLDFVPCRVAELAPGRIREPPSDIAPVDPTAIEVFVVPGLAFDRRGARLGYGKGYYDRALRLARRGGQPLVLGCALARQIVPKVPATPLDEPMDGIVTEAELSLF